MPNGHTTGHGYNSFLFLYSVCEPLKEKLINTTAFLKPLDRFQSLDGAIIYSFSCICKLLYMLSLFSVILLATSLYIIYISISDVIPQNKELLSEVIIPYKK